MSDAHGPKKAPERPITIGVPFTKEYTYLPPLELIWKGAFLGKTMFWIFREWFMEHGYVDLSGDSLLYFVERIYAEKRMPGDREIRSRWRVKKSNHQGAMSSYTDFFIDVDFRLVGIHDEEVMHEGKKIKALKGEVRLEIRGRLEIKNSASLANHPILKNIDHFFRTRLYKQELEAQRKELYRDILRFYGTCKKFFELNLTYQPEQEILYNKLDPT